MGFGIYLWFTKLEIAPIDTWPLLAMTGSGALLGIVRALIGRPYRTSVPPEV
jgi:hypothetical protein